MKFFFSFSWKFSLYVGCLITKPCNLFVPSAVALPQYPTELTTLLVCGILSDLFFQDRFWFFCWVFPV